MRVTIRLTEPARGLIVTADDFGLAPQVNEAVERAHVDGVLTTASLMVGAPAVDEAVAIGRRNPRLRVGLHLVLVEGRPILPPERVPLLLEPRRARGGRTDVHSVHSVHYHFGVCSEVRDRVPHADVHLVHSVHHDLGVHQGAATPLRPVDVHSVHSVHPQFRTNMVTAGFTLFFHPAARRQLAAEIEAQFAAYAATGLPLDHVTTHKHFHLHPTIAGLILRVGKRYGLRAARTPLEPAAVLIAAEPGHRPSPAWVTEPWARLVQARFRRAGVWSPDRVLGLRWSGAMTPARIEALVNHLPPGVTELYTHPATGSGFAGAAPGYAFAEELAALTSPRVVETVRRSGLILGGFSDFATLARGSQSPTLTPRAA